MPNLIFPGIASFDGSYNSQYLAGDKPIVGVYSIAGAGFGAKNGTPYYDDFESESLGSAASPIGELVIGNRTAGVAIESDSYSGTKSLANQFGTFDVNDFPQIYKALSGTNTRVYMAGYVKHTGTANQVWKFGRIGVGSNYSGRPSVHAEYQSPYLATGAPTSTSSAIYPLSGGATTWSPTHNVGSGPSVFVDDAWLFYEVEFYTGTIDASDAYFYDRINGVNMTAFENRPYLATGESDLPEWCMTILCGEANGGTSTKKIFMDTVYIDESRARVVMTDSAIYANSIKWAVQPINTYNDTLVTATRKRQGFGVGDTAFLHLFNESGALVHSGSSFIVAEDEA